MGPEKRKRKSASAFTAEPAKERRLEEDYPTWTDHCGYTVLQIANQQSVLFVGEATLQVLHGAVGVAGKLITVESPPLVLSTGGRFSLAIHITAEAPVLQVPFAASPVVEVSLQSRPFLPLKPAGAVGDPQWQHAAASGTAGQGGLDGGGASAACTFTLHKPTDPRAPASLLVSKEWAQALDEVCSAAASGAPLVLAVLGAKGMGKSSLARLLSNRLLDEVPAAAFLDADVGQPEFTPPGLLSLHLLDPDHPAVGPPHAHSRQPWASRFVGDVSPQHDPQLYLSAVQALYGAYWSWAQAVVARGGRWPPLVVNTHGWVKGLGFDLLTQLLRIVAPTHGIQIRGGAERKNLPRGAFWCDPRDDQAAAAPAVLFNLESLADAVQQGAPDTGGGGGATSSGGGGGAWTSERSRGGGGGGGGGASLAVTLRSLKPVEIRALAWHAWAKRVTGGEPAWGSYESDDFWRNAGSLASLPPWRISLDDLHVQLLAGSLAHHQLGRLLNGAVVGLLATRPPPAPPPPPPQPQRSQQPAAASGPRPSRGAASASATAAAVAEAAAAAWGLDEVGAEAAEAAYPPGRVSYVGGSAVPPPLLPCVGLGIVRAVDMSSRCVYVLTDVVPELLECVGVLVVGRLELPSSLVVGGEVASPYQQLFGLSAEATGAGAAKSRKNLSRSSLMELAG